jgi:hypothetical protein
MNPMKEYGPAFEMAAPDLGPEGSSARWDLIMERLRQLKTTINCGRSIVGEKRQQAMGEIKCVGH